MRRTAMAPPSTATVYPMHGPVREVPAGHFTVMIVPKAPIAELGEPEDQPIIVLRVSRREIDVRRAFVNAYTNGLVERLSRDRDGVVHGRLVVSQHLGGNMWRRVPFAETGE